MSLPVVGSCPECPSSISSMARQMVGSAAPPTLPSGRSPFCRLAMTASRAAASPGAGRPSASRARMAARELRGAKNSSSRSSAAVAGACFMRG